jgi:signal transduction histidine kinase
MSAPTANVLLVDDQPANLLSLEATLEDLHYNLVAASSGAEALRLLLSGDFAAVILDVQMPGLDGFETAKLIRGRDRSRHTPIIFLTAHELNRLTVEEAYALGAVDYIVKPISPVILRSKVAGFVELYVRTREAERLEAERRVAEERAEALREMNRLKDEFLAVLAHELRNPLAPLSNAVEVLRMRPDPDLRWAVDMISRQVKHMNRLVEDLLEVSRVTRGKVSLRKERADLAQAVADGVEACRPLLEARRHRLEVTAPPGLWLEGDPTRLAQVVCNLLNNAAKYTPEGGHVRVTAARERDEAVLRVADDGIGIRPEVLPRVFDLFVQDEAGRTLAQGGLGIGLSLVRSLVEMHGGSVEARSDGPGKGSEFVVRLPAAA